MADAKIVIIGGAADDQDHDIPDNTDPAWRIHQGATDYLVADTTDGSEAVKLVSSGVGKVGIGVLVDDYDPDAENPPPYPFVVHDDLPDAGENLVLGEFRATGNAHGVIAVRSDGTDKDPKIWFQVGAGTYWCMGADDDETGNFKIAKGHNFAPGDKDRFVIDYNSDVITIPGGEFHVTNGNVGIGTTEPTHLLSVSGGDVSISDTSPVLEIRDSRNDPGDTDLGTISFTSSDASAGDDYCATIVCESINGTNKPDGALRFTMFENGTANGVVRMENKGDVSIQKAGTAESIVDFLTLENTVNAATMDGTGSAIHFKQYYYDASSPATEDSAKITVATETNWTSTASTRDSYMAFETSDGGTMSERMRIDSNGGVLIGADAHGASPSTVTIQSNETDANALAILTRSDDIGEINFYEYDKTTKLGEIQYRPTVMYMRHRAGDITFCAGGIPASMTIDSSSNVVIVGSCSADGFVDTSDERIKENITDAPSQWDDLKAIQFKKYNMINGGEERIGCVAQELESILPELVATREGVETLHGIEVDGVKGIKQSTLVMKAMKALQEALLRIEVLESRLNEGN